MKDAELHARITDVVDSGLATHSDDLTECVAMLRTIRDRRLYRETHQTFESYVREVFGDAVWVGFEVLDQHQTLREN